MNLDHLRTYLISKTAITNLVSTRVGAAELNERATMPAIVLRQLGEFTADSLSDSSTPQVAFARVEVDCYGSTYASARAVADAVRKAPMQQYRGMMSTTAVKSVFFDGEESASDVPRQGGAIHRHIISQDYRIEHRLTQPTF